MSLCLDAVASRSGRAECTQVGRQSVSAAPCRVAICEQCVKRKTGTSFPTRLDGVCHLQQLDKGQESLGWLRELFKPSEQWEFKSITRICSTFYLASKVSHIFREEAELPCWLNSWLSVLWVIEAQVDCSPIVMKERQFSAYILSICVHGRKPITVSGCYSVVFRASWDVSFVALLLFIWPSLSTRC